jgi:hypothetical protein
MQTATRWSLPLPLSHTLADLRWPGSPFADVCQPREHGAQAVEQGQIRISASGARTALALACQ